ncbi:MAG TPA: hypothetical protein PKY29_04385 [Ferruginibacter sp.]|nr:hypothetical protein [Ferruginibacter sp.]HRQ20526.1 hypothetical protein [Ferruginibacter sp.]
MKNKSLDVLRIFAGLLLCIHLPMLIYGYKIEHRTTRVAIIFILLSLVDSFLGVGILKLFSSYSLSINDASLLFIIFFSLGLIIGNFMCVNAYRSRGMAALIIALSLFISAAIAGFAHGFYGFIQPLSIGGGNPVVSKTMVAFLFTLPVPLIVANFMFRSQAR